MRGSATHGLEDLNSVYFLNRAQSYSPRRVATSNLSGIIWLQFNGCNRIGCVCHCLRYLRDRAWLPLRPVAVPFVFRQDQSNFERLTRSRIPFGCGLIRREGAAGRPPAVSGNCSSDLTRQPVEGWTGASSASGASPRAVQRSFTGCANVLLVVHPWRSQRDCLHPARSDARGDRLRRNEQRLQFRI